MRNRGWQGDEHPQGQTRASGRAWPNAEDYGRDHERAFGRGGRGREAGDTYRSGWNQDPRDQGRNRGGSFGGSRPGGQDDAYSGTYQGFRDERDEGRFGERGARGGYYGTAGQDWRDAEPGRFGPQDRPSASGWPEDDNRALSERHGYGPAQGRHHHEHNFRLWRDRQTQQFDEDFAAFSAEKQKQFDTEFDEWRKNRAQKGGTAAGTGGVQATGQGTGSQDAGDMASDAARNREGGTKKP